jgi:hypothetical protein
MVKTHQKKSDKVKKKKTKSMLDYDNISESELDKEIDRYYK